MKVTRGLEVENISVAYGGNLIVPPLSFALKNGTSLGVVGPNGAGKSTLLKALLGLIPSLSGTILLNGIPLNHARKQIAYIPQRASIDWDFPICVFDAVLMGTYASIGWFRRPGPKQKKRVSQALEIMGMSEYQQTPIGELSGGQQQRVFFARALVQDASLYLLDEPFNGIDIITQDLIIELLKQLCQRNKIVMVVHHDLQTVIDFFDYLMLLNRGLRAFGSANDISKHECIAAAFNSCMQKNVQI